MRMIWHSSCFNQQNYVASGSNGLIRINKLIIFHISITILINPQQFRLAIHPIGSIPIDSIFLCYKLLDVLLLVSYYITVSGAYSLSFPHHSDMHGLGYNHGKGMTLIKISHKRHTNSKNTSSSFYECYWLHSIALLCFSNKFISHCLFCTNITASVGSLSYRRFWPAMAKLLQKISLKPNTNSSNLSSFSYECDWL